MVEIPLDRALGVYGLNATPLPQSVLAAASQLLDHLPRQTSPPAPPGHGADPGVDLGADLAVAVQD